VIYLFVDTNVIIDFIADRKPFSKAAIQLFDYCEKNKVKIFISSLSYNNIYYVLKKFTSHKEMIAVLTELEGMTETLDVTKSIIKSALSSNFKDFEDAVQYYSATSNKKISAIVTRDPKDYKNSTLSILTPEEAIGLILIHNPDLLTRNMLIKSSIYLVDIAFFVVLLYYVNT
jgi:predicted nucleic acid-binding protein